MARCKGCIHDKVCNMWAVDSGIPFVNADTCEHYKPTADVAPKSEVEELLTRLNNAYEKIDMAEDDVERLEQENEALKDTNEHLAVLLAEAKSEVAREIFAEIYEDCFDQFGYIDYAALAELKNKYTEGTKNE